MDPAIPFKAIQLRSAQSGFRVGCRTLALSAALVLGASSFAHAFPKKAPLEDMHGVNERIGLTQEKSYKSDNAECGFEGNTFNYTLPDGSEIKIGPEKRMLDQGETVHGVWCSEKRAFILTNKKWIIVEAKQDKQTQGRSTLSEPFSYKDISGIIGKGPVSWAATDDRIFVLTDKIREIPLEGETIVHGDGIDLTHAKMMVEPGLLLFEAGGKVVVDPIGIDLTAEKQLPPSNHGGSFTKAGGRIYFGNTWIELIRNKDSSFCGFELH